MGEDDEDWRKVCIKREKSEKEQLQEEEEYKKWLKGETKDLKDKTMAKDLKPLKEYWNDQDLDANERFLRDFILNKRFLETNDSNYIPTYDEIVHDSDQDLSEDEKALETQENFEVKYNHRFEEPDQEFVLKYPQNNYTESL